MNGLIDSSARYDTHHRPESLFFDSRNDLSSSKCANMGYLVSTASCETRANPLVRRPHLLKAASRAFIAFIAFMGAMATSGRFVEEA